MDATIENAIEIVVASCVIHNICIRNGDLNQYLHENVPIHCNVNPSLRNYAENNRAGNANRKDCEIDSNEGLLQPSPIECYILVENDVISIRR